MRPKNPRRLELKRVLPFLLFFLLWTPGTFAAETEEEKVRLDQYLASQQRGKSFQGKTLKKPLEVNPKKTLKRLETHPPTSFRTKTPPKETIERPLKGKRSVQKPFKGKPLGMREKSRFGSDTIKKPLKVTE